MGFSRDYNALKAQTLRSGSDEEAVTVSIRPLIDKVLARYSGEWTVLRELIQNAADASATKVTVRWETLPSSTVPVPQAADTSTILKHTVAHHTLKRLIVTNNGQPFNRNDWSRLKKIAEGNPDETKIGAFGVGFYSVFADCEEPFISSGSEAMAFYWKGNALFTRKLELPETQASPDTSFVLDYRNDTSPVPVLSPLCQFLANSLTFVGLEKIELWLDDFKILDLHKKLAPAVSASLPRDLETTTPDGLMRVIGVYRELAQIDGQSLNIVSWRPPKANTASSRIERGQDSAPSLRSFFSRLAGVPTVSQESLVENEEGRKEEDLGLSTSSTVFLHITTATISTSTTRIFAEELERATKKPPPKTTRIAILTASPESLAKGADNDRNEVFSTVLPTKNGRIFIGFATHQTTGLSASISAPSVIPTVERESIDLNARWVRSWNIELLRAAGIVCRISWYLEMQNLKEQLERRFPDKKNIRLDEVSSVIEQGTFVAQQFSFRESTPASRVGQVIEDAFWTCSKKASIDVLSTCGVLPTHQIRIAPKELSFMDGIPTIPEQIIKGAATFVSRLTDFGLVTELTDTDVKIGLESQALSSKQLQEFVCWLTSKAAKNGIHNNTVKDLLAVAVANDDSHGQERLLIMGDIKYFLNPGKIPAELPTPPSTIPFQYTRTIGRVDLESIGWEELQIVPWVRWLLTRTGDHAVLQADQDLTTSSSFAAQVLPILSRQWDGLSQSSKNTLVEILSVKTVIPTKLGMRRPGESYFPNVKIFEDLAVVQGLQSVKDKFLLALGVRKTLELNVVFDRLLNAPRVSESSRTGPRPGNHVELIKYLASVRDDIPAADIQRLKNTALCPPEKKDESLNGSGETRFKVSELFQPVPQLRELGMRVIEWPGPYRSGSPEGRFLSLLGLRSYPSVTELLELMAYAAAAGDEQLQSKAMRYFLSNHHINNYASYDYSRVNIPFLPLANSTKLSTPSHCFTEVGASLLGYDILAQELHPHAGRFGVHSQPPVEGCVDRLIKNPPSSSREARQVFGYMSSRLGEINQHLAQRLSEAWIVPITNDTSSSREKQPLHHISPLTCFLGQSETYKDIFDFVDFGQEANAFLLKCGSKHEPTKLEVARLLVREPARISATFGSAEKYLELLRSIAESLSTLKRDRDLFRAMKSAPFLLASRELASAPNDGARQPKDLDDNAEFDDLDEDTQGIKEWQLTNAKDAIIVDDFTSYNLFRTNIVCAPQEEALEDFYYALGSPLLSSLVEEAAKHSAVLSDQRISTKLQRQITERAQLFLHEQPGDAIKHDTRWLDKNLTVQAVNTISMKRSLKGRNVSHVEKRSAVVTQHGREYVLWITAGNLDLYQVAQALVRLLLTRPKLHSALTLEMLLKTDLMELRARGFNVSRILRRKAAEARLAEQQRQQQLEEERRRADEEEKQWTEAQKLAKDKNFNMPGVFPGSPDRAAAASQSETTNNVQTGRPQNPKSGHGLFSSLTKRLGLEDKSTPRQLQNPPNPSAFDNDSAAESSKQPPPPYSQKDPTHPKNAVGPVTAGHNIQQNLLSAIEQSRSTSSEHVFSPGLTREVDERKTYCDDVPSHDLQFVAEGVHGIQIFLTTSVSSSRSEFLTTHSSGLTSFAGILKEVAGVFSMKLSAVNIFYDPSPEKIAFNRNGSVFCNYLFFEQLQEPKLSGPNYLAEWSETLIYWFVFMAHELAHNLVSEHNSEHSFFVESFCQKYFHKVMALIQAKSTGQA
ncbi:putative hatpase_c domain-containing protein [Phaeomoniella chlamydospora]|uniref:Putative hatpase_c domain-containing protein n=1 Tax=Phaeomoniella chlamydospora TaxID=158046 RepID=A0A0G2ETI4_PHACM|nr:putative hatpase_c domain-containing protein [Phaeomoniella chlamydospora]